MKKIVIWPVQARGYLHAQTCTPKKTTVYAKARCSNCPSASHFLSACVTFLQHDRGSYLRPLFTLIMVQAQQQTQGPEVMILKYMSKVRDPEMNKSNKNASTIPRSIPPNS